MTVSGVSRGGVWRHPAVRGRSNLTFRLTDGTSHWVMQMLPRHGRTPSAYDVLPENRVSAALTGADVLVPRQVALCDDEDFVGFPFAVADFVAGVCVQGQADIAALDQQALDVVTSRLMGP